MKKAIDLFDEDERVTKFESQQHVKASKAIEWDRKPATFQEVNSTALSSLPLETREHIHNLPVVEIGSRLPGAEMPTQEKGPYIAQHKLLGTFLVNPEGFPYARYVTKLVP